MSEEKFFYDEFFVSDDDPGLEEEIEIRNRKLTVTIKRALTLEDISEARSSSIKTRMNKKTGQPELVEVNESEFIIKILPKLVLAWPFKHRDGRPVEISEKNLKNLKFDVAEAFAPLVKKVLEGREEVKNFFDPKSKDHLQVVP